MTAIHIMRKGNKLLILLLLLALIASCKKATDTAAGIKDQVSQLADKAGQVTAPIIITGEGNQTQIIIPAQPQKPQQQFQTSNVLSPDYIAPCILQKFTILNWYCSGKTLFIQQSTSLSWHIPYWLILLLLLIFAVWFIIQLWKRRN